MPQALVALAAREQSQTHRVLVELEDKLWDCGVRDAELLPGGSVRGVRFAQLREEPMAEPADRYGAVGGSMF